jgi:CRP/FNR family cyclic AMP-dependent transcriptional regulator
MWDAVIERGTEVKFASGSVLLQHGEMTRHCYAILSGEVLVTASSSRGSTVVLARRGAGALVGEQAALDGQPRSATVRAVTDVVALVLTSHELEALLLERSDLALNEVKRLASQMRELTERFALRGEDVRVRILNVLATNAGESGDPVFRSTREELAGWVGATREAVIRSLRELESDGSVRLRRGAVEWVGSGHSLGAGRSVVA